MLRFVAHPPELIGAARLVFLSAAFAVQEAVQAFVPLWHGIVRYNRVEAAQAFLDSSVS